MRKFTKPVSGLTQDRGGVTALEYALIAAVMGALVVTAVTTLGGSLNTAYTSIGTLITTTASGM
jgi:pilus assembly protein Flp/PilA